MRTYFLVLLAAFVALANTSLFHLSAQDFGINQIIVKFDENVPDSEKRKIRFEWEVFNHKSLPLINAELWYLPDIDKSEQKSGNTIDDQMRKLKNHPYFKYAEPNYIFNLLETSNDPYLSEQWYLEKTDAQTAWNINTGSPSVVVGIMDTGIDWTHPDLANNVWTNAGEDTDGDGILQFNAGSQTWEIDPDDINDIDDDGNGYIDDWLGWNFIHHSNNVLDDHLNDVTGFGHGTHCAGIVAAAGNNATGVSGINWNAKLAALKIFDKNGDASLVKIIEAFNYAIDMDIPILNCSWGRYSVSLALQDVMDQLETEGALVVAAAGNDKLNIDNVPVYPAAYPHDNILTVAASKHNDRATLFTNIGQASVDVFAPGVNIFSTIPSYTDTNAVNLNPDCLINQRYTCKTGTSMSAPQVSGLAALLLANCGSFTYADIKSNIINNVEPVPSLGNKCVSGGRINMYSSLNNAFCCPIQANSIVSNNMPCVGETVNFTNTSINATDFLWDFGDGNTSTDTHPWHNYATTGEWEVVLTASNGTCNRVQKYTIATVDVPTANFSPNVNYDYDAGTAQIELVPLSQNAAYHEWSLDGNVFHTTNDPNEVATTTVNADGVYNLCLFATNGCGDNQHCEIVNVQIDTGCAQEEWRTYRGNMNNVHHLAIKNDYLYTGTYSTGLMRFDLNTGEKKLFSHYNSELIGQRVTSLMVSSSGDVWVGNESRLSKFDGDSPTGWTAFTTTNSDLPANWIRDIMEDGNGDIWLVTNGSGIAKFDGTSTTGWTIFNGRQFRFNNGQRIGNT